MLVRRHMLAGNMGNAEADESEALQADVMRFMAILGLCLMVIFALVQSLPAVSEDREAERERAAENSALQQQVQELQQQLNAQLEQNTVISQAAQQQQASLDALEAQVNELNKQKTEAESALQATLHSVEQLEAELAETQTEELVQATEPQAEVEPVTEPEPVPSQELANNIDSTEESPTEDVVEPTQTSTEEGFRLKFASSDAFFKQVASNNIEVYVKDEKTGGYRLDQNGRQLNSSALPAAYQKISPASLPSELGQLLRSAGIDASAEWGVVLSTSIKSAIANIMSEHQSGTLLIENNGTVSHVR